MSDRPERRLRRLALAYLPVPAAGAVLSIVWNVGASPDGDARDLPLRGTALAPPLFLPVALLGAAVLARRDGVVGRAGAAVAGVVGAAFVAGSTANLPNDFAAARAAGTPRWLTAVLAAVHLGFGLALVASALPALVSGGSGTEPGDGG